MTRLLWASTALGTMVVAVLIYGWGQGFFYPCGTLDRFIPLSNCKIIAHWDQAIVEALAADGDHEIAAVLRSADDPVSAPQTLVSVTLDGSSISQSTTLDTDPDQSWANLQVSPDRTRLLAAFHQGLVRLLDRSTGQQVAAFEGTYGAEQIGFASDGKVLVAANMGSFERPVLQSAQRFNADGSLDGQVEGARSQLIYSSGIASVLTPDGTLMVQHE